MRFKPCSHDNEIYRDIYTDILPRTYILHWNWILGLNGFQTHSACQSHRYHWNNVKT